MLSSLKMMETKKPSCPFCGSDKYVTRIVSYHYNARARDKWYCNKCRKAFYE
jgi:transposase-like protein